MRKIPSPPEWLEKWLPLLVLLAPIAIWVWAVLATGWRLATVEMRLSLRALLILSSVLLFGLAYLLWRLARARRRVRELERKLHDYESLANAPVVAEAIRLLMEGGAGK